MDFVMGPANRLTNGIHDIVAGTVISVGNLSSCGGGLLLQAYVTGLHP